MKKLIVAAVFAAGLVAGVEAAPTDAVTKADLQALIQRITQLEAQNKAQAERIAQLESKSAKPVAAAPAKAIVYDEGTTTNETGRIVTTEQGFKYYLADKAAGIFDPLSESGLRITPYGYLVLEGVYADRDLDGDYTTDFVNRNAQKRNQTTLSVQDSILGLQFETPEAQYGWKFTGRAEIDLVDVNTPGGFHENGYGVHWRHLYVNAEHESGWSILAGQTWHLWKIVTPSEIDGAWMENAGHPYRRSPQIRVTKKWDFEDSSFEARVGVLKGGPSMGEDRDNDSIQDNTASPWMLFEGALVYDHDADWQDDGRRWLVGIGGMYGCNRSHRPSGRDRVWSETGGGTWVDDSVVFGGDEDDYDSMMGLVALSLPVSQFTLTGQFYGGENLGRIQAGCAQGVAYHTFNSRGNEVRAIGGFVDLGYKLNDDWSFAIGWGADNPINSDVEGSLKSNASYHDIIYNDRAYICAFYQVLDNLKLGLEYARLLTSYADRAAAAGGDPAAGGDFDANRVQFSAFYDF